jgi:hypothetical protein
VLRLARDLPFQWVQLGGKLGPAVHFHQQVGEFDAGQAARDFLLQGRDRSRQLFGLQAGHDQAAGGLVEVALVATAEQGLHLRQ